MGFAERRRGPSGKWQIRFRFGRIAALAATLVVFMWLTVAVVFFLIFKYQKNWEEVSFGDMMKLALFLNQEEVRTERGDYYIRIAEDNLKEGDFRGAYENLQSGVNLSPTNIEGRLMLAQIQFMMQNNNEEALKTLREGVPYATNHREYMTSYMQAMFRFQHDQEVIEICEKLLERDNLQEEMKKLLAQSAALAHYYRGRYDEAEQFLMDYGLDKDIKGIILSADISWLRGQRQAAIEKLESNLDDFINKDFFYDKLSKYYREMGDLDKARQVTVLRTLNSPLTVDPRIDLLSIYDEIGHEDRARREALEVLNQWDHDEEAILKLANYATESGNVELIRRIYENALENNFNIASFALLVIECHVTAKDFDGAAKFSEDLAKENPDWLKANAAVFDSLRAVAYYGKENEDLCKLYLDQFLDKSGLRPNVYLAVARRFQKLGGKQQAQAVLTHAYKQNPENQNTLTQLIAIELELGNSSNIGPYLKKLLKMRRPSPDVLKESYERLGSDRFIFTQDRDSILIELRSLLYGEEQPA